MNEQLLKMSGTDVYPLGKNSEKPYRGGGGHPHPPPLYVWGLIYWTWAIHRHMKLNSAPGNCSKIWEDRSMTTNTIPCFVAFFCKHVQGARRQKFIGYTHKTKAQSNKWHFQIYTVSSSKFTAGATLSQHLGYSMFPQGLYTHWPHLC